MRFSSGILLLLLLCCCGPPQTDNFKFKLFADNLEKNLAGNSVGYAFTISYQDKWSDERTAGQARIPADAPALAITPEVKFSSASLSKTITAAAAVKLLDAIDQQRGTPSEVMLGQPIGPYLPPDFNADENFQAIIFRDLLQHRSGIGNASDASDEDYASIKSYVSGHPNVANKTYRYSNTNYALFRFLIPRLANIALQPGDIGTAYAVANMEYVKQNILIPAGLFGLSAETDGTTGLNYHFPLPSPPYSGMDLGDLTLRIASQGWVMSTQDLGNFFRQLNYTDNIVSRALAKIMKDECLGYDICGNQTAPGSSYRLWGKGGYYPGCWPGNNGEFHGKLVLFSNDVSLALFINSNLTYGATMRDACGYTVSDPTIAVLDAFNSTVGH